MRNNITWSISGDSCKTAKELWERNSMCLAYLACKRSKLYKSHIISETQWKSWTYWSRRIADHNRSLFKEFIILYIIFEAQSWALNTALLLKKLWREIFSYGRTWNMHYLYIHSTVKIEVTAGRLYIYVLELPDSFYVMDVSFGTSGMTVTWGR